MGALGKAHHTGSNDQWLAVLPGCHANRCLWKLSLTSRQRVVTRFAVGLQPKWERQQ